MVDWQVTFACISYTNSVFVGKVLDAGYAFISGDYRLLPPCNGHEILQDVVDLVHWVASSAAGGLNGMLGQVNGSLAVDTSRIVVAGTSAGGYLAYLAAIHGRPECPLRGVLSMYGMGGNFLVRPNSGMNATSLIIHTLDSTLPSTQN
jgi:acetyl esterase/lipase